MAMDNKFVYAAYAIFVGAFFDMLDGLIARWHKSATRFGFHFDSLADLVTFGIAPIILIHKLELFHMGAYGRVGLVTAFLFSVCSALRLARFNTRPSDSSNKVFVGLPTPGAAAGVISYILLIHHYDAVGPFLKFAPFFMIILSYLMISNLPYPLLINRNILKKKPFINLVVALLVLAGAVLFIYQALFLFCVAYILRGPFLKISRLWSSHSAMKLEPQENIEHNQGT